MDPFGPEKIALVSTATARHRGDAKPAAQKKTGPGEMPEPVFLLP